MKEPKTPEQILSHVSGFEVDTITDRPLKNWVRIDFVLESMQQFASQEVEIKTAALREENQKMREALTWAISTIKNSHEYVNLQDQAIVQQLPMAEEALTPGAKQEGENTCKEK